MTASGSSIEGMTTEGEAGSADNSIALSGKLSSSGQTNQGKSGEPDKQSVWFLLWRPSASRSLHPWMLGAGSSSQSVGQSLSSSLSVSLLLHPLPACCCTTADVTFVIVCQDGDGDRRLNFPGGFAKTYTSNWGYEHELCEWSCLRL